MPADPIVAAQELVELARSAEDLVFVDCRPEVAAYSAGHLPHARHAQLERDLSSATEPGADAAEGGRHPLPSVAALARTLGAWGITPSSHVIAYDAQAGANAAARLWWMLRALGHERVQVVDGGFEALIEAGLSPTTELPAVRPAAPYPASAYRLPVAKLTDVQRAAEDGESRVLDVRAAFRFRGESEPIDPVAGHIPGARNVPYSENLDARGRFKSARELGEQYTRFLGGVAPEQLIVHCGSGVTACHTLLALERAGIAGAKLYVGSWSEWCRRQGLSVAVGD